MKRFFFNKKMAMVIALIALVPFGAIAGSKAVENFKYVQVGPDEVINGNYFAAGEQVEVAGTVQGDVIVAGGVVTISGSVAGDVIAVGGQVRILGPVQGDVRVAGGTVQLMSAVGKNATVVGGEVQVSDDAAIGASLVVAAGYLDFRGTIINNLRGAVGSATLAGTVGENVWLRVDEVQGLVVAPGTTISGDFGYTSPTAAQIVSGAKIAGEVDFTPVVQKKAATAALALFLTGLYSVFKLTLLIGLIFFGLLVMWLFPKKITLMSKQINHDFWPSIGWGALWLVLTPIISFILLTTLIAWPLGLVLALLYCLSIFMSIIVISTWAGERILKKIQKRHLRGVSQRWSMVLGVVLFVILVSIPFIGVFVKLVALATGLGAMLIVDKKECKRYR